MTNPQALREALEQIKANCFRSDITDHTALAGIAIIAKEALASTTVATAATPADARAIVEVCARVIADLPWDDSEVGNANFDDTKEYAVKHLRAKAPEIIAALPLPTPSTPDAALREAVTMAIASAYNPGLFDGDEDAKHRAASPHKVAHAQEVELGLARKAAHAVFAALSNSGQMEKGA